VEFDPTALKNDETVSFEHFPNQPKPIHLGSPEQQASFFSKLTFWWMVPTLLFAKKTPLQEEDLISLHPDEEAAEADRIFAKVIPQLGHGPLRLTGVLCVVYRKTLLKTFLLSMAFLVGLLVGPLAVRSLVNHLTEGDFNQALNSGALLVAMSALTSFAAHHMFYQILKLMARVRSGFTIALYRKVLRLAPSSRDRYATGEVINLLATDLTRFVGTLNFAFSLWMHPLQIGISLYLLYRLLGVAGLLGASVLLIAMFATVIQARLTVILRKRLLVWSDKRLALLGEFLTSIRTIKAYGWESQFAEHIAEQRVGEQKQQQGLILLRAVSSIIYNTTPLLCALVAFSTKSMASGELRAGDVFAAIGILANLRFAVSILPDNISAWFESFVSLRRIENFLIADEVLALAAGEQPLGSIQLSDASVVWPDGKTALSKINLHAQRGDTIAITGAVGAGKSTLVLLVAGEREVSSGSAVKNGAAALVTQVPWILNDTVRNNILFGSAFDAARFEEVLRVCQLLPDIALMPAGVET